MLDGISGTGVPQSTSPPDTSDYVKKQLDKDAFLKILLTEMKYQDPIQPMDNKDFIAQMAQFSSLEQVKNLSTTFERFEKAQDNLSRFQAATLVGKNVVVGNHEIAVNGNAVDPITFQLDKSADIVVKILDSSGNVVKTMKAFSLGTGPHELNWDGTDDKGDPVPEGYYKFQITAINTDGTQEDIPGLVGGKVDAVQFRNGMVNLIINGMAYSMDQVLEVSG